jgi:hypothetical protein
MRKEESTTTAHVSVVMFLVKLVGVCVSVCRGKMKWDRGEGVFIQHSNRRGVESKK